MAEGPAKENIGQQEFKRLWLAIGIIAAVLIGGLTAINKLLVEPSAFGHLSVALLDQTNGSPIAEAFLELQDSAGSTRAVGRSDGRGSYHQGRMPEGRYLLLVGAPGFQPMEKAFRVLAGEKMSVVLHLQPEDLLTMSTVPDVAAVAMTDASAASPVPSSEQ